MKRIKEMTVDIDVSVKAGKDIADIIEESIQVQQAWEKFGGSFTKGLAQALLHADIRNVMKICNTWPTEWQSALELYNERIKPTEEQK